MSSCRERRIDLVFACFSKCQLADRLTQPDCVWISILPASSCGTNLNDVLVNIISIVPNTPSSHFGDEVTLW